MNQWQLYLKSVIRSWTDFIWLLTDGLSLFLCSAFLSIVSSSTGRSCAHYRVKWIINQNTWGWVLKCRADFGQNFEQTRKKRMHSPWVQNHLPKKFCTNSLTFSDFLGRNRNFVGGNWNFVRDFLKNLPWNITNEGLFFMKQAVGLYEEAQITRKRAKYQKRIPQISVLKPSENRPIPSNFFWIRIWVLNGGVRIMKISILWWRKVRKIYCCFLS